MGPLYNYRKIIGGLGLLVIFASLSSDLSLHPNPSLQMTTTASAQTHSALYLPEGGARDANTFEIDKALDAACRKSGQSQSVCLCVTHVMKFEMSLKSYQAATRLYGQPADRTALHRALNRDGFKQTDIQSAEKMERSLIHDADFALRCADAKAYYRPALK